MVYKISQIHFSPSKKAEKMSFLKKDKEMFLFYAVFSRNPFFPFLSKKEESVQSLTRWEMRVRKESVQS